MTMTVKQNFKQISLTRIQNERSGIKNDESHSKKTKVMGK